MEKGDIDDWRRRIDEVDDNLVRLLNERIRCAIEIGKVKEELKIEIYDPRREEEVIRRVQSQTQGPLSKEAIRRLFERIIDETRRTERESRRLPDTPQEGVDSPEDGKKESAEKEKSWSS